MLVEAGLGEAHEAFIKAVKEAATDEDAKALIESVKVNVNKPRSRPQSEEQKPSETPAAPKDFEALKAEGLFNYKAGA